MSNFFVSFYNFAFTMKDVNILIVLCAFLVSVKAYDFGFWDFRVSINNLGKSGVATLEGGGTCRYRTFAPHDAIIKAVCNIHLSDTSCHQKLIISRSGETDLRDEQVYCHGGEVTVMSIGNEIVIAYENVDFVKCSLEAITLDDSNCDCGWFGQAKIGGGMPTTVNEYVSHAALTNTHSKEAFCGAIISKKTIEQTNTLKLKFCFSSQTTLGHHCRQLF